MTPLHRALPNEARRRFELKRRASEWEELLSFRGEVTFETLKVPDNVLNPCEWEMSRFHLCLVMLKHI